MQIEEVKKKVKLLEYVRQNGGKVEKAGQDVYRLNPCPVCGHKDRFTIYSDNNSVLGGEGWKLREFYTGGDLDRHLQYSDLVDNVTLEWFIAKANQGELFIIIITLYPTLLFSYIEKTTKNAPQHVQHVQPLPISKIHGKYLRNSFPNDMIMGKGFPRLGPSNFNKGVGS